MAVGGAAPIRSFVTARRGIAFLATIVVCVAGALAVGATSRYRGSVRHANRPVVGITSTRSGKGYWLASSDGGVFTFGDAHFYGSTGNRSLHAPIVGIAATPSGHGYWLAARDGGVFSFGDARFYGSTGDRRLARPIVGIAATPSGHGYWLVASDGGIFTFGDAVFRGSAAGHRLTAPVVGIARTPTGLGYWLAMANGGVFSFGDAQRRGSARGTHLDAPVLGIAAAHTGYGYWLVEADGTTRAFGHARKFRSNFPSLGASTVAPNANAVDAIAASPTGGYWIATMNGAVGVSVKVAAAPPAAAPAPAPAPAVAQAARAPAATTPRTVPLIALQLLLRMNQERVARHLAPLGWDGLLASRARAWADTLLARDAFYHQNLTLIAQAADGRFEEVGENIFSGSGGAATAGAAHVGFMRSADHRENMLLPQGQLVGIGAACFHGRLVVVEDFAIRMGAPLPPAGQAIPPVNPIVAPKLGGASC